MLIQKVIRNHKRSRSVHVRRGRREQSGSAVRNLCVSGHGQKGQNQYEGYAFDDAKIVIKIYSANDFIVLVKPSRASTGNLSIPKAALILALEET